MIESYNIEEINDELLDICKDFRLKTNANEEYIEYISALLYIIYSNTETLDELYSERKNYYIREIIDEILDKKIRYENRDLFSNIRFKELRTYRTIGEENILSKIIERIYSLIKRIESEYDESQKFISNAYKYIIIQAMASDAIRGRDGEFYTPTGISKTMLGCLQIKAESAQIMDPYCGTGNIILNLPNRKDIEIYGKEESLNAYNICMTNLLLDGKDNNKIELNNFEKKDNEKIEFDYIVSNPPFIERDLRKRAIHNSKISYNYGDRDLAPGDYSYVLSMFEKLNKNGKMAVILPHGVLFRETEKVVREYLVKDNIIEGIIGLPENVFFGSRISVIIMILSKNKKEDNIIFIDASNQFKNKRKINILDKECQEKIINTYIEKKEIKGYSYIANLNEIIENDYNLIIKKYVKQEIMKQKIKKDKIIKELDRLEKEKNILEENIKDVLEKLNIKDVLKTYETNTTYSKVDYVVLGQNIKSARIKKNYTGPQFAERLDISYSYLHRIETGKTKITLDRLSEIGKVLDISIKELLKDRVEIIEEKSENIFYLKNNGEEYARGKVTDKGFVILKGSRIKEGTYDSLSNSLKGFVERERMSNNIIDGVFIEDYECTTPTMAAVLILGRNSNGYTEWKNKEGKTLGEIIRA